MTPRDPTTRLGFRHKLAVAGLATTAALLLGELLARIALPGGAGGNLTPVPRSILMDSAIPGLTYELRPGSSAVHQLGTDPRGYFDSGATLTYRINSLGFRGREVARTKPPGTYRIVGIGDSFTFGTGVRDEDTFLQVLERALADRDRPYEVLNLGVMGYDTKDEVRLLRHRALALEPDLVVICFFLNDTGAGGATHEVFNVGGDTGDRPWWRRTSRLVDLVEQRLGRRRAVAELVAAYRRGFDDAAPGWVEAREALRSARQLAEERGFRLVLMIFPVLWELDESYPFREVHRTVEAFGREIGLPVLDLLPDFLGQDGPALWVTPTNQHPNERGHAIAGRALYRFLVEQGLP